MSPAPDDNSHDHRPDTSCSPGPDLPMAVHCRNPLQNQPHLPSFHSNVLPPTRRYLQPFQDLATPSFRPAHNTSSQQVSESNQSLTTASSSHHLERSRPRHVPPPSNRRPSDDTVTPAPLAGDPSDRGTMDVNKDPEQERKRRKLSDDGWISRFLDEAQRRRGGPDPNPIPHMITPHGHVGESPHMRQHSVDNLQQAQPSTNLLGPSPGARSATLSRRPSSAYAVSLASHSPALTIRSNTSTRQPSISSQLGDFTVGGFSELDLRSRTDSAAPDGEDSSSTFNEIHNVSRIIPRARLQVSAKLSTLEQLPKVLFMRIMMYCGYKEQVLLRVCSYSMYLAVDLDVIPWEKKTETILLEERYNPENFPKNPPTAPNANDEDLPGEDEDDGRPKTTAKRKRPAARVKASSPQAVAGKAKAPTDTYGKWGCYCCYKILPAHYFEGALLEDREGRVPKTNKARGANASEPDKKVDMRVEYVQILQAVPGRSFPEWLLKDKMQVKATSVEAFMLERRGNGVNCDDMRAYYNAITKDSHLVAPIRDITPVFTPLLAPIPLVNLDLVARAQIPGNMHSPPPTQTPLPAIHTREEEETRVNDFETCRPLFKLRGGNGASGDVYNASYTYELRIPSSAVREPNPLVLPVSKPVSRVCLPRKAITADEPVLAPGDVVSLRRVCILCGTKFAIYRRDCNRKIVSKTDEQWWPCDCFEVRAAGRSTGCATCGRKVIY